MHRHLYNLDLNIKKPILHISDVHFGPKLETNFINRTINVINEFNEGYLVITGDIFDNGENVFMPEYANQFQNFIDKINKNIQIIISLGNHDFCKNKQVPLDDYKKFENEHVHIIYDENLVIDNIEFLAVNLEREYYMKEPKKRLIEKLNEFSFNKNIKNHILLLHSPINLTNKKVLEQNLIQDSDLILCGHTHNGAIPDIFSKNVNHNRGLVRPRLKPFPKDIRGFVRQEKPYIIISGGISKMNFAKNRVLNRLYQPEINIIHFR